MAHCSEMLSCLCGTDDEVPAIEVPVPVTHRYKRLWHHMAHSSCDI